MTQPDNYEDDHGIDIEVFIKDGECFQVNYRGVEVHAKVHDYDVEFPCTAAKLSKDEDGDYFSTTII